MAVSKGVNFPIRAEYKGGTAFRKAQADLKQTRRAVSEASSGLHRYKGRMDAASVANRRFSQSLGGSSWRRQVQQAGMQVSDFAVQVAGGQSAILAFTQNAPQFIQNFGAIGGVLAAAVTILGTVAFSWAKTRGAVKAFDEQLTDTTKTLDEYFKLVRSGNGITSAAFKVAEKQLSLTSQAAKDLLSIAKLEAFQGVEKLNESLIKSVLSASLLKTQMADAGDVLDIETLLRGNITVWKDNREQVQMFIGELERLGDAATLDEQYQSAVNLRDIFKSHVDVTAQLSKEQQTFWKQLSQSIQQMELLGAAQEAETTSAERSRAAHGEWARSRATADVIATRAQKQQMTAIREAHEEYARSRNVASQLAERLLDAAVKSERLKKVSDAINFSSALVGAQDLAKSLGVSLHRAMQIKGLVGGGNTDAPVLDPRDPRFDAKAARLARIREIMKDIKHNEPDLFTTPSAGASGGGAAAKSALAQFHEDLEKTHPALRKMLDDTTSATLEAAQEIKSQFEDTQKAISSSMMSAFKGLLDGSKSFGEAARDILGSILDRVIDLLMTPIFNSIAGSITGGIMSGLTGIGASFDGGGFTGAGVRAGGMDGKGGQLAMVHPNETVVDHTKGQSVGGNTVIFNISTPDVNGFKNSQRQLARQAKTMLG